MSIIKNKQNLPRFILKVFLINLENEKTFREILNDLDKDAESAFLDAEDLALNKLKDIGFPTEYDDEDYIE